MTSSPHSHIALEVRQALWDLQKEVLASLKEQFDREIGHVSAPAEWFNVLMNTERFAWMRELTSLMADYDIMTELEFITDQHVGTARAEIERLFFQYTDPSSHFTKKYHEILKMQGHLMPLHSQLKAAVKNLPTIQTHPDQASAERKSWHEEHRHQSRKKRN